MIPLKDDTPSTLRPRVTIALIAACGAAFLWQCSLDDNTSRRAVEALGAIPAVLLARARLPPDLQWVPRFATVFTSMFLHGGWSHIIGNMLFLYAFGRSLEDAMGHNKFLGFYFATGIIAGIVQVFFNLDSRIPTVGASGAIAGVMGAYIVKFPRAEIRTLIWVIFFVTTVDIPAILLLGFWFLSQIFSVGEIAHTHQVTDSGVAFFAHIGGFVAGMILVNVMGTRQRYFPPGRSLRW